MDDLKFDALTGLVAETDAAGPPTPEQQAETTAAAAMDTQAREWGVIAFTIGSALAMLAPELRQVYTEDACYTWGQSAAVVADKYGWNGPGSVPEIGLAIATAGLAIPSYLAIAARLKALKMEQARADQAAARQRQAESEAAERARTFEAETNAAGGKDGG
jgi:hypothetical protein